MFATTLFIAVLLLILSGLPVAWVIGGVPLVIGFIAWLFGQFDSSFLLAIPSRIFGLMQNESLMSIPLFIFMGMVLNRTKIAERTLIQLTELMHSFSSGLSLSVAIFGTLLAACTGIVGAIVTTLGIVALPTMLKRGYSPSFASGYICGIGTLGQIIPPSLVLILLTDVISDSYNQAQLDLGNYSPEVISVGDMFAAAIIPGLLLVLVFAVIGVVVSVLKLQPVKIDSDTASKHKKLPFVFFLNLFTPLLLIIGVLGSILFGVATITEAAAIGAGGVLLLAGWQGLLKHEVLKEICHETLKVTSMVFFILIAAIFFSLVFRGLGGDALIEQLVGYLPANTYAKVAIILFFIFILGFILDFIEIIYILLPLICPILFLTTDINPLWFAILVSLILQTSFLTPPVGFSLFYLRGVAPATITSREMYKGVMPFIAAQLLVILFVFFLPQLVSYLPNVINSN